MDDPGKQFRAQLLEFLDMASAKLAATNEPQTAESLAELTVELFTAELANPATKLQLVRKLVPFVQNWLDGKASSE